jgi:hypothetical protein
MTTWRHTMTSLIPSSPPPLNNGHFLSPKGGRSKHVWPYAHCFSTMCLTLNKIHLQIALQDRFLPWTKYLYTLLFREWWWVRCQGPSHPSSFYLSVHFHWWPSPKLPSREVGVVTRIDVVMRQRLVHILKEKIGRFKTESLLFTVYKRQRFYEFS